MQSSIIIIKKTDHFSRNCKNGVFNWLNIFGRNTFKILKFQSIKYRKLFDYKQKLSIMSTLEVLIIIIKILENMKYDVNKNEKFYNYFTLNYIY